MIQGIKLDDYTIHLDSWHVMHHIHFPDYSSNLVLSTELLQLPQDILGLCILWGCVFVSLCLSAVAAGAALKETHCDTLGGWCPGNGGEIRRRVTQSQFCQKIPFQPSSSIRTPRRGRVKHDSLVLCIKKGCTPCSGKTRCIMYLYFLQLHTVCKADIMLSRLLTATYHLMLALWQRKKMQPVV